MRKPPVRLGLGAGTNRRSIMRPFSRSRSLAGSTPSEAPLFVGKKLQGITRHAPGHDRSLNGWFANPTLGTCSLALHSEVLRRCPLLFPTQDVNFK